MIRTRGWFASVLIVGLVASGILVAGQAPYTEESCPRFERLDYAYNTTRHLEGDLYAVEHVVGYAEFRHCFQTKDRVLDVEVQYEAWGGAYAVRVVGDDFEDRYVLQGADNVTALYDEAHVREVQFAGLSDEGDVSANATESSGTVAAFALDRSG